MSLTVNDLKKWRDRIATQRANIAEMERMAESSPPFFSSQIKVTIERSKENLNDFIEIEKRLEQRLIAEIANSTKNSP